MIINVFRDTILFSGSALKAHVHWPGGRGAIRYRGPTSELGSCGVEWIVTSPIYPILLQNSDGAPTFIPQQLTNTPFPPLDGDIDGQFELPECFIRFVAQAGGEAQAVGFGELTLITI